MKKETVAVPPSPRTRTANPAKSSLPPSIGKQEDELRTLAGANKPGGSIRETLQILKEHLAIINRLIEEVIEDEEDSAESLKALEDIESGRVKTIPLSGVKAKYGL